MGRDLGGKHVHYHPIKQRKHYPDAAAVDQWGQRCRKRLCFCHGIVRIHGGDNTLFPHELPNLRYMSHSKEEIIPHVEWNHEGIKVLLDYIPSEDATPEEVRTSVRQIAALLYEYLVDINPEPPTIDE